MQLLIMVMLYGIIGDNKRDPGVEPQQPRRMNDMGPRRSMDMGPRRPRPVQPPAADAQPVARSASAQATRPVAQPQQQAPLRQAPAPQQQRPMRPQAPSQQRPVAAPPAAAPKAQVEAKSGGWRTVVQVVIGLLVIAAVASAIVVLYIKYYQ